MDTFFVSVHAVAATAAFIAGLAALPGGRLIGVHLAAVALMAAALVPAARLATLEFGLRHEEAVLDWFDALPRLLRG